MKIHKTFFGWTNIKWFIKQIVGMYSNDPNCYFSKKRIESAITFIAATGIILCHVWQHRATITNSEILSDAALLFTIAGYTLNHIQKEKTEKKIDDIPTPVEDSNKLV